MKVFLDANIVIQAGKPPGGPMIARVRDLVTAGLVTILTTDLTVAEVAKMHTNNDYESIKNVSRPHFRNMVKDHIGIDFPEVSASELRASISNLYLDQVRGMFDGLNAEVLKIDDVKPSSIFTAYSEGSGFFAGDGKKHQFPDAFIFESLLSEASAEDPVYIISNDGDFKIPAESAQHVELLKSVPELFQNLGLQVEAPEIEGFLEDLEDESILVVDREVNEWGLQVVDVEDGEIEETSVTGLEPTEIVSFGAFEEGGNILVVGSAKIRADVQFTHPNWDEAIYDSEDKRLIPFDSVSGEKEIEFEADFSLSISVDENGNPAKIEEFRFRNDDFVFVDLYPYDPYQ